MSRRSPPYTPLCNRHLRFYFSNPERTEFQDSIAERQFKAARDAVTAIPESDRQWLADIIWPTRSTGDLLDCYIGQRLENRGLSEQEIDRFYWLLLRVNRQIAISLQYISPTTKNERK